MALLYEKLARSRGYGSDFIRKVRKISRRLGIRPNWLMALMRSESRIDHTAVNPHSGNTGLIQFGSSTAWGLGTTLQELRSMSAVRQLDYVEAFYKPVAGRIKTPSDLYVYTFGVAYFDSPSSAVMATGNSAKYHGGKYGADGKLTKGEFKKYVNETRFQDIPAHERGEGLSLGRRILILFLIVILIYVIYRALSNNNH